MPEKADQQKTNSITHLIAKETFQTFAKKQDDLFERISILERTINTLLEVMVPRKQLFERISKLERLLNNPIDYQEIAAEFKSKLNKAGEHWNVEEDREFRIEIETMLAVIAKKHSRTIGAIKARLFKGYKREY